MPWDVINVNHSVLLRNKFSNVQDNRSETNASEWMPRLVPIHPRLLCMYYCERQDSGHCPVRGMDPPTEYDCLSWFSRAGMCETHMYNDGTFCDLGTDPVALADDDGVCFCDNSNCDVRGVDERENFNHIPQILRTSPTSLNHTLEITKY